LQLDQSQSFAGTIANFGGQDQIDLGDIAFSANTTLGYSVNSGNTGGILTVSDGTDTANITMIGQYTAVSFATASDGNGGTMITDPPATPVTIANGATFDIPSPSADAVTFAGTAGTLQLDRSQNFAGTIAGFGSQDQIDLGDIAFTANMTLGYTANSGNTGGTVSVSNGIGIANIALLGQYTAASFATASDGHGGTMITDPAIVAQTQLTQPQHT
jgi:hypothetical protein